MLRLPLQMLVLPALALALTLTWSLTVATAADVTDDVDAWLDQLHDAHPRLLFRDDDQPRMQQRAERFSEHFQATQERAAELPEPNEPEPADWGHQLMSAAIVYHISGDKSLIPFMRAGLEASVGWYHQRYEAEQPVNWYAYTRLGWLVALDTIWDELPVDVREELSLSFIDHLRDFEDFGEHISREGTSGVYAGFYGVYNLFWYAGLLWHERGIDDEQARNWLERGYELHLRTLRHRAAIADDEGGAATGTLGYAMQDYPVAEWNFFHSFQAAFDYDMARHWPHAARLAEYALWNWIPGGYEFGYGSAKHTDNRFPGHWLGIHMSHILHFYSESKPDAAARAHHLKHKASDAGFGDTDIWPGPFVQGFLVNRLPIYPYLLHEIEQSPPAQSDIEHDAMARQFENMGQTFIRSGTGPDDTFILVSAGGELTQHRHYDAGHFTLYHRGFLALDSGTRQGSGRGSDSHLVNYYAQSIAHNTLLIDMPGEEPVPYWGNDAEVQAGGQHELTGSRVRELHEHDNWVYLACDLTDVYHCDKAEHVSREFVFLAPDVLVIFDRVTSTESDYDKTWLLHTANEPTIQGDTFQAEQKQVRLIGTTLLPEDAQLNAVGGPGREFLVDDTNYLPEGGVEITELMGPWRVEVAPGEPRKTDLFLHVLEIGDQSLESSIDASVTRRTNHVRLNLTVRDRSVTIRFRTEDELRAAVEIDP